MTFNPSVTSSDSVSATFRAFVSATAHDAPPAIRRRAGIIVMDEATTVYIVRGTDIKQQNTPSGMNINRYGYTHLTNAQRDQALVHMPSPETPNGNAMSGELAAALYAATQTPLDAPLQIIAADARLRDALITKVPLWEDRGWIEIANAPLWQQLVNRLRQRIAVTTIKPAHEKHEKDLIKKAKERAQQALLRNNVTTLAEQPSGPFTISGVKLAALTQSLAYKGIRAKKDAPIRRGRDRNLRDIQEHFKTTYNTRLSEQDIWKGVRHVDIDEQGVVWRSLRQGYNRTTEANKAL